MKWSSFNDASPSNGAMYIVARITDKKYFGLYNFYCSNDNLFWEDRRGHRFECRRSDKFCDVEDIIDYVQDMILKSIESEINY